MTTEEKNILMAEFLGVKPLKLGASTEYEMYGVIECIEDGIEEKHFFLAEELLFHDSWDWLMEVAMKCYQRAEDMEAEEWCVSIQDVVGTFSHETTYDECVQFIEWYNKNKYTFVSHEDNNQTN